MKTDKLSMHRHNNQIHRAISLCSTTLSQARVCRTQLMDHAHQISACGIALSAKGPGAILGYAASAPARTRCGSGWRRTRRSGRTRARRWLSATTCAQWTAAAARPATRSLRMRHAELRWCTHLLPDTSDAHNNIPAWPKSQQPSARAMGLALNLEHSSAWASVDKQGAAEPQH